jgi:hypothetical protein
MEPIIQPPESVRQTLRGLGVGMVLVAAFAVWKLPSADVIEWLCVGLAGACLVRIPWDYRISGPGLGGWALLILSSVFSFVFIATTAKMMMLLLTGTGAWLTGVAPQEDESESVDS